MGVWNVGQLGTVALLSSGGLLRFCIWAYQVVPGFEGVSCVGDDVFVQVSYPLGPSDSDSVESQDSLAVESSFFHHAFVTPHWGKTGTALSMGQVVLPLPVKDLHAIVSYCASSVSQNILMNINRVTIVLHQRVRVLNFFPWRWKNVNHFFLEKILKRHHNFAEQFRCQVNTKTNFNDITSLLFVLLEHHSQNVRNCVGFVVLDEDFLPEIEVLVFFDTWNMCLLSVLQFLLHLCRFNRANCQKLPNDKSQRVNIAFVRIVQNAEIVLDKAFENYRRHVQARKGPESDRLGHGWAELGWFVGKCVVAIENEPFAFFVHDGLGSDIVDDGRLEVVVTKGFDDVLADFGGFDGWNFLVEFELFFYKVSEVGFDEVVLEHDETALAFFVLKVNFVHDFPVFEHEVLADVFFERRGQVDWEVNAFVIFWADFLDFDDHEAVVDLFLAAVNVALFRDLGDVLVVLGFDEFFDFL